MFVPLQSQLEEQAKRKVEALEENKKEGDFEKISAFGGAKPDLYKIDEFEKDLSERQKKAEEEAKKNKKYEDSVDEDTIRGHLEKRSQKKKWRLW